MKSEKKNLKKMKLLSHIREENEMSLHLNVEKFRTFLVQQN